MYELDNLSRNVRKRTFEHVRIAKIQISLRIHSVLSEFSLGAFKRVKDAMFIRNTVESRYLELQRTL